MTTAARASIAVLPDLVKNQIAAGEVIERPASVVKELVENALDAGARRIEIELEEGGVKLVRVRDDGAGMPPEDLALCFASHATSKLASVSDLEHIATLGFRGEALASIGSVARCRITSRPAQAALGAAVEDEGGRISAVEPAGGPLGTEVAVRDLFFNTPARRRFLRTTATELGRCLDVVQRLALASDGVGFVLTHDGRRVLDVEPEMDLRGRVRRIFGAELAEALAPAAGTSGTMELAGFVAPPRFARRDTARQMWFLNGRPLRDKILARCLKDAYKGFLFEGQQPAAFLRLAVDPAQIDVNVHPAKAEVRFREERRVFAFLVHHLRSALMASDMATPGERLLGSAERRGAWSAPAREPAPVPQVREVAGMPFVDLPPLRTPAQPASPALTTGRAPEVTGVPGATAGPFLQFARTYIARSVEDGFEIVDQHALHERVTYEELKRDLASGGIETQRLLVPEIVELDRALLTLLEEHLEALAAIGILLSPFGATSIAVQGLPARLGARGEQDLVRACAEAISARGAPPTAAELLEEVLHRRACRSSVMAGDRLSDAEIRALLERAERLACDQTCPHGRPTRVRFTLADLEKAFHRR